MPRRRRGDDSGVSSLELAIIAPSLLLLIFFVIQVALYLYGRSVALQSAREGVSQLRLAETRDDYDAMRLSVRDKVQTFAGHVGGASLADPKETSRYDNRDGGRVTVKVTGKTVSLIPFLDLHVTEQASGQVERFQDSP